MSKMMICTKKESCFYRFCDHIIEHDRWYVCDHPETKLYPDCPACVEVKEVSSGKDK